MPDAGLVAFCVAFVVLEFVLFVVAPSLRALARGKGDVLYYVERCRTEEGWVSGYRNVRRHDGGFESEEEALRRCDRGAETFGGEWRVRRAVSAVVYERCVSADPPPALFRPRPAADSTEADDV